MSMQDTFLRELFSTRGELAQRADELIERCNAVQQPGETLAGTLSRLAIFHPTAPRTLDLMRKGFVARDVGLLFAPDGPSNLAALLDTPPTEPILTAPPTPPLPPPAPPRAERGPVTNRVSSPRGETIREQKPGHETAGTHPHPAASSRMPVVGDVLGRCLITAVLGKGGHGVVYAALHQSLNIPVAVKVLLAANGPDPYVQAKLRHEARALARLNHPNIIRILDFDDGDPPYAVTEYVEGPSLADLITQTGGLRVERARDIIVQVCRGLAVAWAEGIVHRDIKPANILLTRSGEAKLADLGLALTSSEPDINSGSPGTPIGTCAYMAPEQARTANEVDFTADIYSLGVTFYHAVTGQHPFPAKSPRDLLLKHATEQVVPPHVLTPHLIDETTSAVIVRMMAKNPADRYASYDELIAALATPANLLGLPTPPPTSLHLKLNTEDLTRKTEVVPRPSGLIGRLFTFRGR